MSDKSEKELKRIMVHQKAFVSLKGSNEKDLMRAANSAKKTYNKGKNLANK